MSKVHEGYLIDLGVLVKEMAVSVREEVKQAGSTTDDYLLGRKMALYEVISLMRHQAWAFGLPMDDVGLGDFDPDRDLL